MTCVLAAKSKNSYLVAADSGVWNGHVDLTATQKLIRKPGFVAGFAGDWTIIRRLQVALEGQELEHLEASLASLEWPNDLDPSSAAALVATKTAVFHLDGYGSGYQIHGPFTGLGECDAALGYLHSREAPYTGGDLRKALGAQARWGNFCRRPFLVWEVR